MKPWTVLIVLSLAVVAAADDKPKDKDKKPPAAAGGSADALAREAEARIAAGDAKGAVDLLRRAAAAPGASGEQSLRLGTLLDAQLDLDGAIDAYTAAAARLSGPARAEALGRMSVDQELRGMAQASATATDAQSADAASSWANVALARVRAREGKGEEALALAQKADAAGGAGAAALGCAQEALGDFAAAEASFRRAQADPTQPLVGSLGLARVLRKTGRAADAEALLKGIVDQAPGVVEAYKESARVKMALGRAGEAVADAATAAAVAEGDAEAQRLVQEVAVAKSVELLAQNRVDEAIQELTRLRDQNPGSALARTGLARAYIAKRQADLALAELDKALQVDPGSAEAQFRTGYAQQVLKRDAAAALPHLEKAAEAEPANLEYRTQLGAALIDLKQFDRAAKELARVTSGPGAARTDGWIYLGAAELGAKRYKDAIAALEKASALKADDAQVEAYLAWAYFGLKDSKAFLAHAGRARALGHKEPTLLEYLGRVEKGEPIK
jgi:tetratricopeptide (TPR) repeat protein